MEAFISSVEEQRTPSLSVNLGDDLRQLETVGLRGRGLPGDAELVILFQTDRDSHSLCSHFHPSAIFARAGYVLFIYPAIDK